MKARLNLFALVAVLAIAMTVPAGATSGITVNSFTTHDNDPGDPVGTVTDTTTTINYDWLIIDMDGAIDVEEDSNPAAPNNGDKVGTTTINAKFPAFFCIRNTYTFDTDWVSPISGSAPAGTTAQFNIQAPTGDIPAYVIPDGSGNDRIHVDMRNTDACTSDPRVEMDVTTYARVNGNNGNGAIVARNTTAGTYTINVSVDTHSDTASYTVS
jgi:hypothetical protein